MHRVVSIRNPCYSVDRSFVSTLRTLAISIGLASLVYLIARMFGRRIPSTKSRVGGDLNVFLKDLKTRPLRNPSNT
jgi:hypothetical protein